MKKTKQFIHLPELSVEASLVAVGSRLAAQPEARAEGENS
jgi:hypothetical protein